MRRPLLLFILTAVPLLSHAIEEPDYEVIGKLDNNVELRKYAPYVVAEVVLEATADDAGNQAFPILAGYIFGKNKGDKKFAMTAPVTQTAAPVRRDMTAPVTQSAVPHAGAVRPAQGRDAGFGARAGRPRVQLRLVPATRWAVIRCSGTWSQSNYQEHLVEGEPGSGGRGHTRRTHAGALQRALHAVVHAAQRDLVGIALKAESKRWVSVFAVTWVGP